MRSAVAQVPETTRHYLSEYEASYIVRDIVRGLGHLSKVCHIMHRDIKLDNILVKRKPQASRSVAAEDLPIDQFEFKLGDLGLAKSLNRDSQLHETICGTPLNMAPEVIKGYLYD